MFTYTVHKQLHTSQHHIHLILFQLNAWRIPHKAISENMTTTALQGITDTLEMSNICDTVPILQNTLLSVQNMQKLAGDIGSFGWCLNSQPLDNSVVIHL